MLGKFALSTFLIASVIGVFPANAQTYRVCEADSEGPCPPHQVYTGCGSIAGWAQNACKVQGSSDPAKYTLVKISDSPGGQCGYALFEVTCK
jgi:hypothetical protein